MRPAFSIVVDGIRDITGTVASRLMSLSVTDKAGVESDRLTVSLDDRDGIIAVPRRGAELAVSLGYEGRVLQRMGVYFVDEVEVTGPVRTMTIRANAADMTGGIKAPRERSFDKVKFGDIVAGIAGEHGLTPSVPSELADKIIDHADQSESDMQFLSRLASQLSATVKIADKRLIVAKRAAGETTSGRKLPTVGISAGDCAGWSASIAERAAYKSVLAYYHDAAKAKRVPVTAGSGEPVLTLRNSYKTKGEAEQAAKSRLEALSRATASVQLNGVVGDPLLSAERLALLSGFRAGVDGGGWVVDEVTHTVDVSGYTCDVSLVRQK